MEEGPQPGASAHGCAAGREQRRHGRIRCESVRCSNGYVLDLSASGARLQWMRALHSRPGSVIPLEIQGVGEIIAIRARIVWSRRIGWRRHQVGVEFQGLGDEERSQLALLVRSLTRHSDEPWSGSGDRFAR